MSATGSDVGAPDLSPGATRPPVTGSVVEPPVPTVPAAAAEATPDLLRQGRYAGIVSRGVSMATDAVVLAVVSVSTLFVIQAVISMIRGVPFSEVTIDSAWGVTVVAVQATIYFTTAWAVFGRTGGEALFGLRMVRRDGRPVKWGRAFLRFLVSPLAYSFCGVGFFWILIDSRRRTWPDLVAGTVVVYDWRRAGERPVTTVEPHH